MANNTVVKWQRRVPGLLMASPAVVVYLLMFIAPMALAFFLSLTDWNGYSFNFNFVGFKNYISAFDNPRALDAMLFTLGLAVAGTLLVNVLALTVASLISGPGIGNAVVRTVFFYPYIIAALIIGFLWNALLSPNGVVNSLLTSIGLSPVPFLSDPAVAKVSVLVTLVWAGFGVSTVLYIAGLKSIPAEYYEAATVDGAGRGARFRHITLPLLAPVVTVTIVLTLVGFLRTYELVLALSGGGPAGSTETIVFQILNTSFVNGKLGFGAAQSVILLVVTAIFGLGVTLFRRRAEAKVVD